MKETEVVAEISADVIPAENTGETATTPVTEAIEVEATPSSASLAPQAARDPVLAEIQRNRKSIQRLRKRLEALEAPQALSPAETVVIEPHNERRLNVFEYLIHKSRKGK